MRAREARSLEQAGRGRFPRIAQMRGRDAMTQQCACPLGALEHLRSGKRAAAPFLAHIERAASLDVDRQRAHDAEACQAGPFGARRVLHGATDVSMLVRQRRDAPAHVPFHHVVVGLRAHMRYVREMGIAGARFLAERMQLLTRGGSTSSRIRAAPAALRRCHGLWNARTSHGWLDALDRADCTMLYDGFMTASVTGSSH